MNESQPESDEQVALKKRARRRLIGAIVFVSFAAVVLPMVMDAEPPPATPSIELNIPAQDKGFAPPATGAAKVAPGVAEPVPAAEAKAAAAPAQLQSPPSPPPLAKAEVPPEPPKPTPLAEAKPATVKPAESRPAEAKVVPKAAPVKPAKAEPAKAEPAKPAAEAKRAQSILDGKAGESSAGGDVPHVVLIGAFANQGNVQILQKKLGEMGMRVYTEPLDSPQGKKTRVRAGPFPSREAAEKAVARMKAIGVGGVVAPKP